MTLKFFVEVLDYDSFFLDSASLHAYLKDHDTFTRHGCFSLGSLEYIDSPDLRVVFDSRSDYERFKQGVDIQISLF